MSYTVALNFEDGVSRFIQCNPDETVLDAAYRQQVNLPMDCADGVCGSCKCHCEQGDYQLGDDYLDDALSAEEAGQRQVLTCQMVPQSDCVIDVPMASTQCKTGCETFSASVVSATALSDSAIEFSLQLDDAHGGVAFCPASTSTLKCRAATPAAPIRSAPCPTRPGCRSCCAMCRAA